MSQAPESVALIPYYGPAPNAHHHALRKAQVSAIGIESTGIDSARIVLLELALRTKAEVFVFIDSDVVFTRQDYDSIVRLAYDTAGIVGGDYPKKNHSLESAGVLAKEARGLAGPLSVAHHLGMGFTAISRVAAQRVAERSGLGKVWVPTQIGEALLCSPLFMPLIDDGHYMKEDFAFCCRARAADVSLFLDTSVRPIHLGETGFQRPEPPEPTSSP